MPVIGKRRSGPRPPVVPGPAVKKPVRFRVLGQGEGTSLAEKHGLSPEALQDIETRVADNMFRLGMLSDSRMPPIAPKQAFVLGCRWSAFLAAGNEAGAEDVLRLAERVCEGYGIDMPELQPDWSREDAIAAVEAAISKYTQRHVPPELHEPVLPIDLPAVPAAFAASSFAPHEQVLPASQVHDLVRKAIELDRPRVHAAGYLSAAVQGRQANEICHLIGEAFEKAGYRDDEPALPLLREILQRVPSSQVGLRDTGTWRYCVTSDGKRGFVESSDFSCDARMYLDGDFGDAALRERYGRDIARRLNATALAESTPPEGAAPLSPEKP